MKTVTLSTKSYLTIQSWMIEDLKLKGNELILFSLIYGFSQDKISEFSGSISYMQKWLGVQSRKTVFNVINSLIHKGLILKCSRTNSPFQANHYIINHSKIKSSQTKSYLTIQSWMIEDLKLKGNELILFSLIYGFSQDEISEFSGSISYMQKWLGAKNTVINTIKKLLSKNLIIKITIKNNVNHYKANWDLSNVKNINKRPVVNNKEKGNSENSKKSTIYPQFIHKTPKKDKKQHKNTILASSKFTPATSSKFTPANNENIYNYNIFNIIYNIYLYLTLLYRNILSILLMNNTLLLSLGLLISKSQTQYFIKYNFSKYLIKNNNNQLINLTLSTIYDIIFTWWILVLPQTINSESHIRERT